MSLWNISSSVLKATGLTRLSYNEISSGWTRKQNKWVAYYPSTPASNALLLSSRDDIPVRANIRVRGEAPVVVRLSDSNFRISDVAPTPSSS
jgi:hypothetical protein